MRRIPIGYAVFCLIVLSIFTYAKYEGMSLFNTGTTPPATNTGSGGGHGAGFLLGAHK